MRLLLLIIELRSVYVSIHAPREGCDTAALELISARCLFQFTHPVRGATPYSEERVALSEVSIHAPREGCDRYSQMIEEATRWFQFTHPVRGATAPLLALQRERDVSIHAPREGCDHIFTVIVI